MKTSSVISLAVSGLLLVATSYASASDGKYGCSDAAKAAMDASFGSTVDGKLTSDITKCLTVREDIKVVVNVSSNAINGKNGIVQQINNAKNLAVNYEDMYGMSYGDGYKIAVVIHGSAAKFAQDTAVFDAKYGTTNGNAPTVNTIKALMARGIHVYMCQNSMRANSIATADLIPGMEEVPSGVTAVTDFGMRRWVVLTP